MDPEILEIFESIDDFYIQQRIRWGEALTQGCFEQLNMYDVFNKNTQQKVLVIKEESNDCNRCCCAPEHSLFAKFYLVDESGEARGNAVLTMEREGCDCGQPCPKPCLCCFACTEKCSDGAVLYSGDLQGDPGDLPEGGRNKSAMLGSTIQPINGGKFRPVLQIMERDEDVAEPGNKVFAASQGPCCFGGCSELCCSSEFGITKATDEMTVDEIHDSEFDYATITKMKPEGLGQALREAFTDSDLFEVSFKYKESTPVQKANLMATMILKDYMFFERDNDMCYYENDACHIVFFNCFCYGCICPCKLVLKSNSGN